MLNKLFEWLAGLGDPHGQAQRAQKSFRDAYILEHSEAFEDWLKGECEKRGMHFPRLYSFIQANSERLERECAWINQSKALGSLIQSNRGGGVSK